MTNVDIAPDVDEVDSTYTTMIGDDIQFIETSNEWSAYRDKLVEEMLRPTKQILSPLRRLFLRLWERPCNKRALGDIYRCGVENPFRYERFGVDNGNDMEIPTMFSQGLNTSLDEFVASRLGWLGDSRNASSGLKRKKGGHSVETTNIIQNVMEYANDQLNCIENWPILRN
ncbi:retrotransposon protein [Cucumis melo var. makuwa]|uniref:Retrotransposon protein n=1 Tax=Cucumis melo var. makuwa TaxID=1194695 RepID=A0A5A7T7Z6_CUCMM|nr:retrotransposon protein [Cucumis melo var. makuwa]